MATQATRTTKAPKEAQQESTRTPVILGLDPGTQVTGWGAIALGRKPKLLGFGIIRPPQKKPLEQRIATIYDDAVELIRLYEPTVVAVEDPFVGKSARSALVLGQARGVLLLAATRREIEVAHYPPRSIKSSVVGNGNASKEQVQYMVQKLLGLKSAPEPLDASDALAVALCHINRNRFTGNR